MKKNKHVGSTFDSFLEEEGILDECTAIAVKRMVATQLKEAMKENHLNKVALADKMKTSRTQLNRVLDPEETGTSIESLTKAAIAIGKRLEIHLS